jgi:hypothetical protein
MGDIRVKRILKPCQNCEIREAEIGPLCKHCYYKQYHKAHYKKATQRKPPHPRKTKAQKLDEIMTHHKAMIKKYFG